MNVTTNHILVAVFDGDVSRSFFEIVDELDGGRSKNGNSNQRIDQPIRCVNCSKGRRNLFRTSTKF